MNRLAGVPFEQVDREAFTQMIDCSHFAVGELHYVRDYSNHAAAAMANSDQSCENKSKIAALSSKLSVLHLA